MKLIIGKFMKVIDFNSYLNFLIETGNEDPDSDLHVTDVNLRQFSFIKRSNFSEYYNYDGYIIEVFDHDDEPIEEFYLCDEEYNQLNFIGYRLYDEENYYDETNLYSKI